MTESLIPDLPLVTFALFAYNQEKYIREAVEGAFSQTYEPLEIILSDDCSSDRTFEIMQEMAAAYDGPHQVRLNRTTVNRGLGAHINTVLALSNGEWIIVAAGDDISLSDRTCEIIRAVNETSGIPKLVHSAAIKIDQNGVFQKVSGSAYLSILQDITSVIKNCGYVLGATAAWHHTLYRDFEKLPEDLMYEDQVFQVRALLSGDIIYVQNPLVKHRDGGVTSAYSTMSLYDRICGISNDRWIIARQQQIRDIHRAEGDPEATRAAEEHLRLCRFRGSLGRQNFVKNKIAVAIRFAFVEAAPVSASKHLFLSLAPALAQRVFISLKNLREKN